MALVAKLVHQVLEKDSVHMKVDCTYSIIVDNKGQKYLQLDTYGSAGRKIPGKKSQSIRLSPEAITQLLNIIKEIRP
ncbi:MAG: methionyl-tRNA formyltransferase [Betaproteobacteria bacterium]